MDRHVLTVTVVFLTGFLALYVYLTITHKERMAMIDRGITPNGPFGRSPLASNQVLQSLKWGLIALGIGIGLAVSLLIRSIPGYAVDDSLDPALMFIGGGLGLVVHYIIASKKIKND